MTGDLPEAWANPAPPRPAPPIDWSGALELPNSRVIARLRYEPDANSLLVGFRNGAVYRYFGVSPEDYAKLAEAPSPGARFNQDIAPYHETERIS